MSIRTAFAAALLIASSAGAQSAGEHVALGDREHAARNPGAALKHYEAAIAADANNYEALYKAARDAIDSVEFSPNKDERTAMYKKAEGYARRAVAANPNDPEGHFHLARAIGKAALSLGAKDRVKYAGEVRAHALAALKLDPKHPGALHVMGVWNAEVMRLSGVSRWFAKNLLGGKVFGEASWENAVKYMEESVAVDPGRLVHKLDLAKIYLDMGNNAKARENYDAVTKAQPSEPNDAQRKDEAKAALAKLGGSSDGR